jgi:hypothetical protein
LVLQLYHSWSPPATLLQLLFSLSVFSFLALQLNFRLHFPAKWIVSGKLKESHACFLVPHGCSGWLFAYAVEKGKSLGFGNIKNKQSLLLFQLRVLTFLLPLQCLPSTSPVSKRSLLAAWYADLWSWAPFL